MQPKNSRLSFSVLITLGVLLAAFALLISARPKISAQQSSGDRTEIFYERDDTIFPNPERGFFVSFQPTGGGRVGQQDTPHPPLKESELRALSARPEAISLIRDGILIPRRFWTQPISKEYLDELQANFDAVRAAGLKTVPRFLYDWGMQNRDPDEAIISFHLQQLAPLIQKNADVIAWMQGGLFGGAGEGNASDHGYVFEKYTVKNSSLKWQGLSPAGQRLLLKELKILPQERMLVVRYPRFKWDLFHWDSVSAMRGVLTPGTAFDGSDAARIGFYNEGFMGSPEHYAMFQLPDEAQFTAQDSEFVVHEGEISDASKYKLQDNQVVTDATRFHMTALHYGGDAWPEVSRVWKENEDYDEVARRLGYRFRLLKASLPRALRPGGEFVCDLQMTNDGFARAMNPRGVEVVLRNTQSGAEYSVAIHGERENRLWLPAPGEKKSLQISAGIPPKMPPGNYEVFLNLPDPQPTLYSRPEYSIRLANKNVWEAATGFNRLHHTLKIDAAGAGREYSGHDFFMARKSD
jgi:hypothetical protein